MSAKHVGDPKFSLDSPGTDSYRHLEAGAEATVVHSETSTSLLLRNPIKQLEEFLRLGITIVQADIIILEGFRFWTQKHPQIAKIICIRSFDEIPEFQAETVPPILGLCSLDPKIQTAINIPDEFPFLLEAIDKWLLTAPIISLGEVK